MAHYPTYSNHRDISPKGLIYLCLILGLGGMAYGLVTQNWIIFIGITLLPLSLLLAFVFFKQPLWSYVLLGVICCYCHAIYRYSGGIPGSSGIIDVAAFICLLSLIINRLGTYSSYEWKNAINVLTICQAIWVLYCILSLLAPYTKVHNPLTTRGMFITIPLIYLLSSILMCTPKRLKYTFFLLGIFIVTAAFKLVWQRRKGFDSMEVAYLLDTESWQTHLLSTGIRYFSFFSDAGNFGITMGTFTAVFGLLTFIVKKRLAFLFCLSITILSAVGMFMSGTRSAIAIPLGGLLLYTLINKNLKQFFTCSLTGILLFSFFYFTNIGDDNTFIRRMRTAFRPTEDASYNVRAENRKLFAYYLAEKPFGVGVGGRIEDSKNLSRGRIAERIPTDASYVDRWAENGIVGLCLYLSIIGAILIRSCYLILYRIRNDQLRKMLSALLCSIFGLWITGTAGQAMEAYPCTFLIPLFLAFVQNGPYIDKQLARNEIIA